MLRHIEIFMAGVGAVFAIALMIGALVGLFWVAFEYPLYVGIAASLPIIYGMGKIVEFIAHPLQIKDKTIRYD